MNQVAEILKDRPSWYCDCRSIDIIHVIPTGNGGTIELIYMQIYERSLTQSTGGPSGPNTPNVLTWSVNL
uniref:START domain-containing protein n=1 Tax=Oryza meridionalis TaxID=40149 RepID=A0A0E0FAW5_9ORYZ